MPISAPRVARSTRVDLREIERAETILLDGFDPRTERHPDAPKTRADCVDGPRPCPWSGCRLHLWCDVGSRSHGSHVVKWNFRGVYADPTEMPPGESCAMDLAEKHAASGMTLEQIGRVMRVHAERVRQVSVSALKKVRAAFEMYGINAEWLEALALEVPESMFSRAVDRAAIVAQELELDWPEQGGNPRVLRIPKNGYAPPPTVAVAPTPSTPTPDPPKPPVPRTDTLFLS